MSYQRRAISAWDPTSASAQIKMLDDIAERLASQSQRLSSHVSGMSSDGAWSGSAHDAASEQIGTLGAGAKITADGIKQIRAAVTFGLTSIDTARLQLLHLADLAEANGILVSDNWALVPLDPAAPDAAVKLAEWTTAITVALAGLVAADSAAAAAAESATATLGDFDGGMQGFLPLVVIGLASAIDLATAALIATGVVSGAAVIAYLLDKFGVVASVDEILSKIPDVFRSDDGPGQWEARNHHMSERAMEYQEQVTGSPPGTEYVVDGVAFDGFGEGTLRDAKGPGYEQFLDENGEWKPFFKGADELVKQAERQLAAAGDTPVEWSVAEERAAEAMQNTLDAAGFGQIEVVFVPPK